MRRRLAPRAAAARFPVEVLDAATERLPLADASVDVVVSTGVLCSVDDPPRAWPRRGGCCGRAVACHSSSTSAPRAAPRAGRTGSPVWRRLNAGCHPNRDTLAAIRGGVHGRDRAAPRRRRRPSWIRPLLAGVAVAPADGGWAVALRDWYEREMVWEPVRRLLAAAVAPDHLPDRARDHAADPLRERGSAARRHPRRDPHPPPRLRHRITLVASFLGSASSPRRRGSSCWRCGIGRWPDARRVRPLPLHEGRLLGRPGTDVGGRRAHRAHGQRAVRDRHHPLELDDASDGSRLGLALTIAVNCVFAAAALLKGKLVPGRSASSSPWSRSSTRFASPSQIALGTRALREAAGDDGARAAAARPTRRG